MPPSAPAVPTLLSCSDIARRIRRKRGSCDRVSVWRAIQRLQLEPALKTAGGICFYNKEQAEAVADDMRKATRKSDGK